METLVDYILSEAWLLIVAVVFHEAIIAGGLALLTLVVLGITWWKYRD